MYNSLDMITIHVLFSNYILSETRYYLNLHIFYYIFKNVLFLNV